MTATFEVGGWVTITGQIKNIHHNGIDLGVKLFSKTDQYMAYVRRDLCAPTTKPIPDEPEEGSVALVNGRAWQRVGVTWVSTSGIERMRWASLQERGDVEVIHHA